MTAQGKKADWLLASAFAAFFLPAALIGFLALGMVADQKKIRENELRDSWRQEIARAAARFEAQVDRRARELFASLAPRFNPLSNRPAFLRELQSLLLENRGVSYPFVFDPDGRLVVPGVAARQSAHASEWMEKWTPPVADPLWRRAEHVEFSGPGPLAAIPLYLALARRLPERVLPDLYAAVSRCYLKAGWGIQAREYGLSALRLLEQAPMRADRLDLFVQRQLGRIALSLGQPREAFSRYLQLYESLASSSADLSPDLQFLRWEALDFLKNNRDIQPFLEKGRMAEIDSQILDLYRGNMSLFSALEAPGAPADEREAEHDRFLKLKEIFDPEAGDTLFYRFVEKRFVSWRDATQNAAPRFQTGSFQGTPYLLTFAPLVDGGTGATCHFGCRLQVEEALGAAWREITARIRVPEGAFLAVVGPDGSPLFDPQPDDVKLSGGKQILSVAGRTALAGWTWQLRARNERLVSALASRSLRWYYALIASLFATLGLGIALLLSYLGRERALLRQKADFVAMTSHALKTPLARLRLLAEKLEQGWTTDPSRAGDDCRAISDETANMAQLVDRVLDLSALQSGRASYRFGVHEIAPWLDGVLRKFELPLAEKDFSKETEIANDLPPVRMDPEAMATVLSSLIENVLVHAAAGKHLCIAAYRRGTVLEIAVSDRGPGIAGEDRERLFAPFARGRRAGKGSGLGLAVCRRIVGDHGGTVRAEENPGGGARFVIALPLAAERTGG